jgi:type I restriction enzyme S subunit
VAPDTSDLPELPEGWCWATLEQLGLVTGGLTKNAKRDTIPTTFPYLRVANVYANELRLEDVARIGVEQSEIARVLLCPGDLLVVEGNGSIDQIGRVALWDGSIDPCLHQNHIIKVRFVPISLSGWVLQWLLSPGGRQAVQTVASSTSGLHTLSISKVASLPVPLCPMAEQERLREGVDRLLSVTSDAEAVTSKTVARCARLRQSILRWTFEGRLVNQDPADEPAHVLLERIRAERAACKAPQPARRKGSTRHGAGA